MRVHVNPSEGTFSGGVWRELRRAHQLDLSGKTVRAGKSLTLEEGAGEKLVDIARGAVRIRRVQAVGRYLLAVTAPEMKPEPRNVRHAESL